MYYKKDKKGIWWRSENVHLPSGEKLTPDNKTEIDGWEWHDKPPQEYVNWVEERENNSITI